MDQGLYSELHHPQLVAGENRNDAGAEEALFKLNQARAAVLHLTGAEDREEVARQLEVRDDEVEEMALRMAARDASLDVEMNEGDDYSLLDTLADDRQNQEERLLLAEEDHLLSDRVAKALQKLSDRERHIVQDRILSENPRTLQELADDYGISRERVRQLEKSALEKIRQTLLLPA